MNTSMKTFSDNWESVPDSPYARIIEKYLNHNERYGMNLEYVHKIALMVLEIDFE
jgi:hypothetical protein